MGKLFTKISLKDYVRIWIPSTKERLAFFYFFILRSQFSHDYARFSGSHALFMRPISTLFRKKNPLKIGPTTLFIYLKIILL